jgi:alpha-N-arabinofuranosidase
MDYLSLHYYTVPGGWGGRGPATGFDTDKWYHTMKDALYMDELVTRHSAIMDQYDPEKKIGMSVDEWGGWYDVEPGTNPGFLYQQNTVRDALIAGITLNIFNKHCDRVKIAALAQMVNVLQSVILTEGEKMVKTPTYHVMHMYRHHQGAQLLESTLVDVAEGGNENYKIPTLTESVSVDKDGVITITLNNLTLDKAEEVEVLTVEGDYRVAEARIVTGDAMDAHNTFDAPERVVEQDFTDYEVTGRGVRVCIPSNSVVMVRLSK